MERRIYRFYCYSCMKEYKSRESFPLECLDGKIRRIRCPGCRTRVPLEKTNLSPDRYKLVHIDGWCVADEDAREERLLFTRLSLAQARQICDRLNQGRPL